MNLYELFTLGVSIKYIVVSILYMHINVPMTFNELKVPHTLQAFSHILLGL